MAAVSLLKVEASSPPVHPPRIPQHPASLWGPQESRDEGLSLSQPEAATRGWHTDSWDATASEGWVWGRE